MPTIPTDPQFANQWHLTRIGDISRIWDEYRGGGIRVGVYDDGVERDHADLNDNYNSALHVVFGGVTFDGNVASNSDAHGTSVAGLIGAEANGSDTVGIAYESDLTGVNIFDSTSALFINSATPAGFYSAIAQGVNFDVVNHSWGSTPGYASFQNADIAGSFAAETNAAFEINADNGRGGLGTIVVKSSGNESRNSSAEGINNSRFTITVAASSNFDRAASYSNHGSNILVTAPGSEFGEGSLGITTTDRTGTLGYNLRADGAANSDFTDDFGGTSAAAPIVSGVVTLMLDANEGLGWRDVQNILSYSSTHLGGALDGSTQVANENGSWAFNGAENWNGGGLHIHTNYGYGQVNVYNAVRMAEVWTLFGPAQTSANEQTITVTDDSDTALPDLVTTTRTFNVAAGLEIEHIALTVDLIHTFHDDLVLTLIAPDGTRVVLEDRSASTGGSSDAGLVWTYGIDHLRGVTSGGVWTLEIADVAGGDTGTLRGISATFYGTTADANDVYHFTDEFAAALALDPSRSLLTDSDGGVDWINLAAVTGNIVAYLAPGINWTLNGAQYLQIGAGQLFENVVTGDGNDTIAGNSLDNELRGMRGTDQISGNLGNDLLFGGAGDDELFGNSGNDFLDGGVGADLLQGGQGNDSYVVDDASDVVIELQDDGIDHVSASINYTLTDNVENLTLTGAATNAFGNSLANTIIGNAGGNYLDGSGGDDVMQGLAGNDIYIVDSLDDRVVETVGLAPGDTVDAGGVDEVQTFNFSFSLAGGNGLQFVERLALFGTAATNGTGNALNNYLQGSAGNNILDGGTGNDYLAGFAGNDIYILDSLGDIVDEVTAGGGIDTVRIGFSYTLGTDVENLELQGSGNINGTGNGLANDITGTSGTNRLDGGVGDDILRGGLGNDTYVVNSGGDVVVETLNGGTDTVETSAAITFMADNVENLLLTGTAQFAFGNALANRMIGTNGSDGLFGGAGVDTLQGLGGDDIYSVDNVNDRVVETLSLAVGATDDAGGVDHVYATVSYSIDTASNVRFVENLTLQDGFGGPPLTTNINGTGNALNNGITGNNGNNILDGGLGNDTLVGLLGNDIFLVDAVGDVVIETAGQGTDTIRATISIAALAANVENLELQGVANLNGTGNAENNAITGTSGNNRLDGLGGNDVLNGGLGADQMLGGAGDDQYFIDNGSDRVFETVTNNAADTNDAGGIDHITTSIAINMNNYNGIRFVENATLTGTANLTLTGNALNNILTGNTGRNTLDGGLGADTLRGGRGDDIYIVDSLSDVTDETGGDGIDLIRSSVSWTLGAAFENLELTGTANLTGTGNALANRITGNAGDNYLDGGAGTDTLIGGAGNDTYIIDSSGDRIIETITISQTATNDAGGIDAILSSVSVFMNAYSSISFVEHVLLTGSALTSAYGNALNNNMVGNNSANTLDGFTGDDFLTGNGGNDTLIGGMGSDTMEGGADRDRLTGGAGQDFMTGGTQADTFVFGVGDMGNSQVTADQILDWSGIAGGQGDRIDLSAIDANTANGAGTNEAFSFIGGAAFSNVAGQLRFEVISGNSFLMGDSNGDGVADLFLRLNGVVTVGAGDLTL